MNVISQILSNRPLWIAILSFAVAQLIKILLSLIKVRHFEIGKLMASGGMPSSHSAFICALSISVGKAVGFETPLFAICAVISLIVMYDAAGVRRSAGEQAVLVNLIVEKIEEAGIVVDEKVKEFLGHRPIEVGAGALLGIAIGAVM
jgi:acid phosphatase family membrane protein YuiD